MVQGDVGWLRGLARAHRVRLQDEVRLLTVVLLLFDIRITLIVLKVRQNISLECRSRAELWHVLLLVGLGWRAGLVVAQGEGRRSWATAEEVLAVWHLEVASVHARLSSLGDDLFKNVGIARYNFPPNRGRPVVQEGLSRRHEVVHVGVIPLVTHLG